METLNSFIRNEKFNYPNNFKGELEDHVNLSVHSKCKLGKLFDPNYIKIINYPYIGKFNSVMSLWYWLNTNGENDKIRKYVGKELFTAVKDKKPYRGNIVNFRAIIGYATWLKVKEYPDLLKELKELPDSISLISYHIDRSNKLRLRTAYSNIIISVAEEIRSALKENRQPNFDKFISNKSTNKLVYLENFLSSYLTEERFNDIKELDDLVDTPDIEFELHEPETV